MKNVLNKLLTAFSTIVIFSKIIFVIWWTFYLSYWDTPIFPVIEVMGVISNNLFLIFSIIYLGRKLFVFINKSKKDITGARVNNKSSKLWNTFKSILFILSIINWLILIHDVINEPYFLEKKK